MSKAPKQNHKTDLVIGGAGFAGLALAIALRQGLGDTFTVTVVDPALAAAVTPIMKLLVVVETLNGSRITWSMARTLRAPEPMPSSPLRTPASPIRAKPAGTRWTPYACMGPKGPAAG